MKHSAIASIALGLVLGVMAAPVLAQRAPTRPTPPSGGPTPPPPATNPIPPRPSSSGVGQNSGLVVTSTFPRSTPSRLGTPPVPVTPIVRPSTDL